MKLLSTTMVVSPPGKESLKHLNKLKETIASTNYIGLYGITLGEGDGVHVKDVDGNVYLDCLCGASVTVIGYNQGNISEKYYNEAKTIQHTCFTYSPNSQALDLASQLIDITPGTFEKRVMFGLSGSDASGGAIKIMRKYTGIQGVVHFKNDYHGSTGLSEQASHYGRLNDGIYPDNDYFFEVPFPTKENEVDQVLMFIEKLYKEKKVGGVILEAIQGDAGVQIPSTNFLPKLYHITQKYNAVFAVDEVQSGMGRTGKWWAIEHEGIAPDVLITAKSLGGGYAPISAVIGRKEMIETLEAGQHIFTFGGHNPSAAAANATINFIRDNKVVENAEKIGSYLLEGLIKSLSNYSFVKEVRGKGLMIGVEVEVESMPLRAKTLAYRCVEKGVYVGFFGVDTEVIRIEPPLIINYAHADLIIKTLKEVTEEMNNGNTPQETINKVKKYCIGI